MTLAEYKSRRPKRTPYPLYYNPPNKDGERWIEQASKGLRLVGTAYEIGRREGWRYPNHKGWFIDEFQAEVYQGIVYQLPSRKGELRFLPGYADPWNDDCFHWNGRLYDNLREAVQAADSHAEHSATKEREYQAEESRKFQLEENTARIQEIRTELRAAFAELRTLSLPPTLCTMIRSRIRRLRDESHTLYNQNLTLERGY